MLTDYNEMILGVLQREDTEYPLSIVYGSTDRQMEMGVLELGDEFCHVSSFDFVDEYIEAIANNDRRSFRSRFSRKDLYVSNCEFLRRKSESQLEISRIISNLLEDGRRIVLTFAKMSDGDDYMDAFRSFLRRGTVISLKPYSFLELRDFCKEQCSANGVKLTEAIQGVIAYKAFVSESSPLVVSSIVKEIGLYQKTCKNELSEDDVVKVVFGRR